MSISSSKRDKSFFSHERDLVACESQYSCFYTNRYKKELDNYIIEIEKEIDQKQKTLFFPF